MHPHALFVALAALIPVHAQYALQSSFSGTNFFANFDFQNSIVTPDPTLGYTNYVGQTTAEALGMINVTDTSVSWGVEHTEILDPTANLGRQSLRLTSFQSWTHGLFVLDLAHMPEAQCGSWPAFWTLGSGIWPTNGEIDIIEYTNSQKNNILAAHTSPGCSIAGADQSGTLLTADCNKDDAITGCSISAQLPDNEAQSFNAAGGGVYVMEWTSLAIKIWLFNRDAIPASIYAASSAPDVDTFGEPIANFQGSCDLDAHFNDHSLVFDIDFCGEYAGNTYGDSGCPMLDPVNGWTSCNEYVALNPEAYSGTYWEVNYLNVYQTVAGSVPSLTSELSSVTPAISTSSLTKGISNAEGRPTSISFPWPPGSTSSFTATSSVLSVLSSISAASFESTSTTDEISAGSVIPSSSAIISTAASLSSSLPFSSSSCTEATCTNVATVVETFTVFAPPAPDALLRRQLLDISTGAASHPVSTTMSLMTAATITSPMIPPSTPAANTLLENDVLATNRNPNGGTGGMAGYCGVPGNICAAALFNVSPPRTSESLDNLQSQPDEVQFCTASGTNNGVQGPLPNCSVAGEVYLPTTTLQHKTKRSAGRTEVSQESSASAFPGFGFLTAAVGALVALLAL